MENEKHTPTRLPWKVVYNDVGRFTARYEIWSDDVLICPVDCRAVDQAHNKIHAELIVTAVNSHAALERQIEELENPMPCGHFGANLQPDDGNADVCMVCAEVYALKRSNAELVKALEKVKETIRGWNGIGVPKNEEPKLWQLYQSSPEMKLINTALAMAKGES